MKKRFDFKVLEKGELRDTIARPNTDTMLALAEDADQKRKLQKKHKVGDGWHYVPGDVYCVFNMAGGYWFMEFPTSEGCVLLHAKQLCDLHHTDFHAAYREAYQGQDVPNVDSRDPIARPARLGDEKKVIESLHDINYHALAGVLYDMWFNGRQL